MNIHIIGAGGVGTWLAPALVKLLNVGHDKADYNINIWDGDKIETSNLDRQLYSPHQVGLNKAEACVVNFGYAEININAVPRYLSKDDVQRFSADDFFFGCADNHPARADILSICDDTGAKSIIGGNGYEDADAYYYDNYWKGTPCDPRVYYPEILTVKSGSPIVAEGCTGDAQEESPQLVLANQWAASLMTHLFWHHERADDVFETDEVLMLERTSKYETLSFTAKMLIEASKE